MQTLEYGSNSYQDQPADFMHYSSKTFVDRLAKSSTPEKCNYLPVEGDESALLSQLNEACQLSSALQRGLDMCSSISAGNRAERNRQTETTSSEHPVARHLDELRHLYRQVWSTIDMSFCFVSIAVQFHQYLLRVLCCFVFCLLFFSSYYLRITSFVEICRFILCI